MTSGQAPRVSPPCRGLRVGRGNARHRLEHRFADLHRVVEVRCLNQCQCRPSPSAMANAKRQCIGLTSAVNIDSTVVDHRRIDASQSGSAGLRRPLRSDLLNLSFCGGVAQLGERRVRNAKVVSSILILSTTFYPGDLTPACQSIGSSRCNGPDEQADLLAGVGFVFWRPVTSMAEFMAAIASTQALALKTPLTGALPAGRKTRSWASDSIRSRSTRGSRSARSSPLSCAD